MTRLRDFLSLPSRMSRAERDIAELYILLGDQRQLLRKAMATLDQVLTQVKQEGDRIASLETLLQGLRQQVKDAAARAGISPEDQTKLDEVFTQATSNTTRIQQALEEGVPTAGAVPPDQTPPQQ